MATEKGPSDVRPCSQLCRIAGVEPSDTGSCTVAKHRYSFRFGNKSRLFSS
ncbi:rCG61463 [Rattus norvegicus]|uniref:RCG61463 n=1 Tax=Rattus norvegicus TaxID=10116 RepID=A6HCB0_RAT|nr:rCG61463 [Rattus norvegicus]